MTKKNDAARIETGVRNLDELLHGGLPKGSVVVLAGPPGAGKTILTQQICFHIASARQQVLYFNTLSEPTAKTLRHLKQATDKELVEILYLSGEHVRPRQFLSGLDDTIRTQRTRRFSVVKTRGSSHDRGTHYFSIIRGGIRIGERVSAGGATGGKGRSAHRRAKR